MQVQNHHKLIIMSHKDFEHFNVIIMSYKDSSAYVQRMTDEILQSHHHYCWAYVNNIIIFFKTFDNYVSDLMLILSTLKVSDIILKTLKCFIKYLQALLLSIRVNMFKIIIDENCIKTITAIKFSQTFYQLKIYLSKTEYLRSSVQNYV